MTTDFSGLFGKRSSETSFIDGVSRDIEGFLTAFAESQNGLVAWEKDTDPLLGSRPNEPVWKISFRNQAGDVLSHLRILVQDRDGDGKPDLVLAGWVDTDRKLAVDSRNDRACLKAAVADNLEAYQSFDAPDRPYAAFISGIQSFADAQPQSLASALVQYAEDIRRQPMRYDYKSPSSAAAKPVAAPA